MGVITGIGKGIVGLIYKPVSGIFDMTSKTIQGVVNTPGSIVNILKSSDEIRRKNFGGNNHLNKKGKYFGIFLEQSFDNSVAANKEHIIFLIIDFLSVNALNVVGIFRINGNFHTIDNIANDIDSDIDIDFFDYDIHDVSGLFLKYFKELPEPLVPMIYFDQFVDVGEHGADINQLIQLLNQIPIVNKIYLSKILPFLHEISANSKVNLMTSENLSLCLSFKFFGQPPPLEDLQKATIFIVRDTPAIQRCLTVMIENNQEIISSFNLY